MNKNKKEMLFILIFLASLIIWSTFLFNLMVKGAEYIFKSATVENVKTEIITELAEVKLLEVTYYEEPYKITVYTPYSDNGKWGYLTATGVKSKHLATCAVDPNVIPLGSVIEVNGLELQAVDTGSAVKGRVIDIFYDGTYEQAIEWISNFGIRHNVDIIS